MMKRKRLIGFLVALMLLTAGPALILMSQASPASAQENLLKNPGFEGITCRPDSEPPECLDNWSNNANFDGSFHDNIFTPQGWITWWRKGGDYGQPEVKTIPKVPPFTGELERIRSGHYAVLMFTYYRLQDMGLYQVVEGLEPHSTVELSAHAHGWSCDDSDAPMGYTCDDPWNQTFQVGIDPNGGTDPFSPNIVWSTAKRSPDRYSKIGPATAQVGDAGTVTVFLRSKTKWMYKYQDAYWDDAKLVMTAPGTPPTNTPPPPPPTATFGPTPTPRPTSTPRPDGSIVHVVQSGDTLFAIANKYGIDPEVIKQLNAGSLGPNNLIVTGQELVISVPSDVPEPTDPPPPATPEAVAEADPETNTETNTEANGQGGGGSVQPSEPGQDQPDGGATICVAAYRDQNGDTFKTEGEPLLPEVKISLANASGVLDQYTTDGVNEPHCFQGLPAGTYRVIARPPQGFEASGMAEQPAAVVEGTTVDLAFGVQRIEGEETDEVDQEDAAEPDDSGSSGNTTQVIATVAKIGGVVMLVLAAATAVLFVLNRRRL